MKLEIQRDAKRQRFDHGWLKTAHSFSFARYFDPDRMGFGALRVINDDWIAGGAGFDDHFHDNMEIITIPLSGTLEHRDSLGNVGQIKPGEVQHMSAGYGLLHAEYNPSPTEAVSLLQIWVLPKELAIKPRYAQKRFDLDAKPNQFVTVVAPDHQAGDALPMNQESVFYLGRFSEQMKTELKPLGPNHGFYVFVIEGGLEAAGETLEKRDAFGMSEVDALTLDIKPRSFILVMDVPMLG
ncbi:pirin family protein [Patescibacteria group bacterium]|jgi:hypothetical protein|nr:pirin family protein [Patescibacteria group bacterium]